MSSCSGKTALVTDASRGAGRAAALALGKAGAQVLVHHHRKAARADAVVEEIRAAGAKALAIAADIAVTEGPHDLAKRAREIVGERLDVLVVNACVTKPTAIEDVTVEMLDAKLAADVRAPFFLIQQLLPILGRNSSIIFTSPPVSALAPDAMLEYAPTSANIANLVNHFARLLGPRGIRVNAIAPIVNERGAAAFAKSPERRAPHRSARLQDLGAAITFLASNEASRITGETLRIESWPRLQGDLR